MHRGFHFFILFTLALVCGRAAASEYPSRPVAIVVPFGAGGTADLVGRVVARRLTDKMGSPFIVENKPGAGSAIAASYVARARADGYTLLLATNSAMAINPTLSKSPTFDPEKDFVPLGMVAQGAFFLVTGPALPVKSVADVVRIAKEKPKQVSFASSGAGSSSHVFVELMMKLASIDLLHVPYRSSPLAMNDVIAGRASLMFVDTAMGIQMRGNDKVHVLGVSTATRSPQAPDVPPIADYIPGYDATTWLAIVAPANTPKEVVNRLHDSLSDIVTSPDYKTQLAAVGLDIMKPSSIQAMQQFTKAEITRWGQVLRDVGLAGTQ